MKKALIDADILVYRVAWASEDVDGGIAKWRMDDALGRIQDTLETDDVTCFLTSTDKSNFRYELFPDYKTNRKQPKPRHYECLREFLIKEWEAKVVYDQEADDQLGIEQTTDSVICTIDKDLNQVPGWHFNFVTGELFNIGAFEALRCFYEQCLVGDKSTDNIEGCPKIGKVKAAKILDGCENELELLTEVVRCYNEAYKEKEWADRLLLAGNLLWVRKKPNQSWELQNGEVVSKKTLESFLTQRESDLNLNHEDMSLLSPNNSDTILQTSS